MRQESFQQSVKSHQVALISLVVAILALLYTGWREEQTDRNRTIRMASFEVLKNLGELQVIVNFSHYQPGSLTASDPLVGWGYISLIGDLSQFIPPPVPGTVDRLIQAWKANWSKIREDEGSVERISQEIDKSRQAVSAVVKSL